MAKNKQGQEVLDQRINISGRSRQLSVGKILPKEWEWVRITRTRSDDNTVWLQIKRLTVNVAE